MSEPTRGPWTACADPHDREGWIVATEKGVPVASVEPSVGGTELADARLLAAAPDLLAMVREAASWCAECAGTGRVDVSVRELSFPPAPSREPQIEDCRECADLRAAIAKATAGTPTPALAVDEAARTSLRTLVAFMCDAYFACGDWRRDESEEKYDDVSARAEVLCNQVLSRITELENRR